jgi:hypothetical protein
MNLVDDLSEQALALASQEDDDAAVAELVRIAGGDRAALDRAADTLLKQAPTVDPASLNLRARAIGLLTRALHAQR